MIMYIFASGSPRMRLINIFPPLTFAYIITAFAFSWLTITNTTTKL